MFDPFLKNATLVYGLVKDHPFHDANKTSARGCSAFYSGCTKGGRGDSHVLPG